MSFKDHFSGHAASYERGRPRYPAELFRYLASLTPAHDLAVDCACGNGQASVGLAAHYAHVAANDASVKQLRQAQSSSRISYFACTAERQALRSHTADLFAVAQAAHWFDFERFYPEVRRVLKPGGVVALISYGLATIEPEIDAAVSHVYNDVLGPYWPAERHYVEENYRTLPFPFAAADVPEMSMTHEWTLAEYLAYVETWSALQRYRAARNEDPLPMLRERLARVWNSDAERRSVVWPLNLLIGCV